MVAMIMDVARRGAQFTDPRVDRSIARSSTSSRASRSRRSATPLAQDNLFIYPEFAAGQPWQPGKTSSTARVTFWAVAHEAPWPIAESVVTVVRTSLVDGARRPVDETAGRLPRRRTRHGARTPSDPC